jgi:hypothetical protein
MSEAKKDCKARLAKAGIAFDKLKGETVSFEGFGYGRPLFVNINGATVKQGTDLKAIFADVPKPSEGGYVPHWEDTRWTE